MKEKSAFWLSDLATKIESILLALLILFLPTQLGKHFWPEFTLVTGIRVDYLSPTIYTTDILIGLLLVSVFVSKGFSFFNPLFSSPLKTSLLILCLTFFVLNIVTAERLGLSTYYFLKLLEFSFLGFYISQRVLLPLDFLKIGLLFALSSFFESFLAILQYLQQGSLNGWLYYLGERTFTGATPGIANASINGDLILRPYGTFSHPNVLSGFLLISAVIVCFLLLRRAKGFIKLFSVVAVVLSFIAITLTLSRVAIGLLAVLGIGFLFYQVSIRLHTIKSIIGGTLLAAIVLWIAISSPIGQLIIPRFTETSFTEEALLQREELIASAFTMFQSNPIDGVGLGNFIVALAPLQDPLSLGLYLQPVHNIYLLTLAETGIVGLTLLLVGIILTYCRLVSSIRSTPLFRSEFLLLTLLLSLILVIGLFDHYFLTLQQGQLLFAVVLGLCWIKPSRKALL